MLNLVPGADIRFANEPSEFLVHFWNSSRMITHTEVVDDFPRWGGRATDAADMIQFAVKQLPPSGRREGGTW